MIASGLENKRCFAPCPEGVPCSCRGNSLYTTQPPHTYAKSISDKDKFIPKYLREKLRSVHEAKECDARDDDSSKGA